MDRKSSTGLALAVMAVLLAGCQNNAAVQDMMAAQQMGLGVATVLANARSGSLPATAGVVLGTMNTAQGAAALAASPNLNGGKARPSAARLPDTPQCREYLMAIKGAVPTMSSAANHAQMMNITALYNRCLDSAPNHPASKRLRCGKGKYTGYFGAQKVCGTQGMAAASTPFFARLFR